MSAPAARTARTSTASTDEVGSNMGPPGDLRRGTPGSARGSHRAAVDVAGWVRRHRRALAVAGVLLVVGLGIGLLTPRASGAPLDPDAAGPAGSRALAQLLRARHVVVTRDVAATLSGSGPATDVVPFPGRLTRAELAELAAAAGTGDDVVLVAAGGGVLGDLHAAVQAVAGGPAALLEPLCPLPEAQVAGLALVGGIGYEAVGDGAVSGTGTTARITSCYDSGTGASLVVLPSGSGRVVLLGSGAALTNDHLDQFGNAALALGLLDRHHEVRWLLPPAGRSQAAGRRSLTDLIPTGLRTGVLQLGVVVVLLALWRGRRLGPPVPEELPVVVPAAEAVQGRARLYAAARARTTAADALREGARARLAARLGLSPAASEAGLVAGVCARTGGTPAAVADLLYGSSSTTEPSDGGPAGDSRGAGGARRGGDDRLGVAVAGAARPAGVATDAQLVALADDLDHLERQVEQPYGPADDGRPADAAQGTGTRSTTPAAAPPAGVTRLRRKDRR